MCHQFLLPNNLPWNLWNHNGFKTIFATGKSVNVSTKLMYCYHKYCLWCAAITLIIDEVSQHCPVWLLLGMDWYWIYGLIFQHCTSKPKSHGTRPHWGYFLPQHDGSSRSNGANTPVVDTWNTDVYNLYYKYIYWRLYIISWFLTLQRTVLTGRHNLLLHYC